MMSKQENLYIHIYTGVRTEGITYINPEETFEDRTGFIRFHLCRSI